MDKTYEGYKQVVKGRTSTELALMRALLDDMRSRLPLTWRDKRYSTKVPSKQVPLTQEEETR